MNTVKQKKDLKEELEVFYVKYQQNILENPIIKLTVTYISQKKKYYC